MSTLDERIADLIQADIDGELQASDRVELETALQNSEAARQFREELLRLAERFQSTPDVDPPEGLARRILDSVELPARQTLLSLSGMADWFRPLSYGLAVAAGVLIAIGVERMAPQQPADFSKLVGSMVGKGKPATPAHGDTLRVNGTGVRGEVRLKPAEQAWVLEFDLESDVAVAVNIRLDPARVQFGGFADPATNIDAFEVSGGDVQVNNQGRHQYVVFLRDRPETDSGAPQIGISVSRAGHTLYEGSLNSAE